MSITQQSMISLLRERMHWHQARQKVLSENISNTDTPGFRPRDLEAFKVRAPGEMPARTFVPVERTDPNHLVATGSGGPADRSARRFETTPSGNAVHLDDEMLKVAENQSEYQLATTLYQKSLAMLRQAAGVRGA